MTRACDPYDEPFPTRNVQSLPPRKQGDRVVLSCVAKGSDVIDLRDIDVHCEARRADGTLVAVLSPEMVDAEHGQYTIEIDTLDWPVGSVYLDVRYTWPGGEIASDTFHQRIEAPITRSPRT